MFGCTSIVVLELFSNTFLLIDFSKIIELLLPVSIIIPKGCFFPCTVVSQITSVAGILMFAPLGFKATLLK
jgi:hypothetical protein